MYHVVVCHHEVIKRRYIHVCSGLRSGGLLECCIHFLYCSNTLKLTSIRNTVARITSGIPKYAHISIGLYSRLALANWFPIEQRINFKTSYLCATFSFGDLPENFPYACLLFICK